MDSKIHDEPSSVSAQDGQVIVDGPDAVAVTLTPEAADETGERLIAKAIEAAATRRRKEWNAASDCAKEHPEAAED